MSNISKLLQKEVAKNRKLNDKVVEYEALLGTSYDKIEDLE